MDMESVYEAMGKRGAVQEGGRGFDKEEWAARKKGEREAVFALADETALRVNGDMAARRSLAGVMGRLPGHSATNALLILAQAPGATRLGDAGYWRRSGARIGKGERAISVIEPTKEFVRPDGTIGVLYAVRKVFDASQTTARPRLPRELPAAEVLTALVARSPAPVSPADAPVPGGARYDPATREIEVERGRGTDELFSCLAREACRACMDLCGDPAAAEAELAAAIGARFGIGGEGDLPQPAPEGADARAVRSALSRARSAAAEVGGDGARPRAAVPPGPGRGAMRGIQAHEVAMAAAVTVAAAWLGALLAPALDGDRGAILSRAASALSDPLKVQPTALAAQGPSRARPPRRSLARATSPRGGTGAGWRSTAAPNGGMPAPPAGATAAATPTRTGSSPSGSACPSTAAATGGT